jgi:hypothetical protein
MFEGFFGIQNEYVRGDLDADLNAEAQTTNANGGGCRPGVITEAAQDDATSGVEAHTQNDFMRRHKGQSDGLLDHSSERTCFDGLRYESRLSVV